MHDRVDLGALVVVLLHLGIVREQPRHVLSAAAKDSGLLAVIRKSISPRSGRDRRARCGPALAVRRPHCLRRGAAAETVGATLHPIDVGRLDAELVLHQPSHVDRGGHRIFRHAAALALEIGAGLDALRGVDEEIAVAEHSGGKHRNGDERRFAAAHQRGVVRQRHLGRVELLELQLPPENLGRLHGDVVQLDALDLDGAVAQRLGAIVGSAGEVQTKFAHGIPSAVADRVLSQRRRIKPSRPDAPEPPREVIRAKPPSRRSPASSPETPGR